MTLYLVYDTQTNYYLKTVKGNYGKELLVRTGDKTLATEKSRADWETIFN